MKVRTLFVLMGTLFPLTLGSWPLANAADGQSGKTQIVFLMDGSEEAGKGQPPETLLAAVLGSLDLMRLSETAVAVGVVQYGGTEVTVIGNDQGLPESSLATVRQKLLKSWRKPAGERPLDQALQEVVRMRTKAPTDSEMVLIHCCSGEPDSQRCRPEDFPAIQVRIEKLREQRISNLKGFGSDFIAEALAQLQREIEDQTTDTFADLYSMQVVQEVKRALQHADSLKKAGIRVFTLNLASSSENGRSVDELHRACGGTNENIVATTPDRVFELLSDLIPQIVPGVRRLAPIEVPADPDAFEARIEIPIEKLAVAADVSWVFEPAIARFSDSMALRAKVDGSEYEFSLEDEPASETQLYRDAQGNVCGARLRLTTIPTSGQVTVELESPDARLHMPKMVFRTSVRLSESVKPLLRPLHSDMATPPPFTVSPKAATRWAFSLVNVDDSESYELGNVEIILRDPHAARDVLLPFAKDGNEVGLWVTEPIALPVGMYDAHCTISLPSSAVLKFVIPLEVISEETPEIITFEIAQPVGDADDIKGSYSRSHLDFGRLGDAVHKRSLNLTIRLKSSVTHAVQIHLEGLLADCNGVVPADQFVKLNRSSLTLFPGRKEVIRVSIELPERIETAIEDGVCSGRLVCTRSDTGQVLPVERFEEIIGVPSDAPIDVLSVELFRPRALLSLRRALHEWIVETPQDGWAGHVRVDVTQPFGRTVALTVTNSSEIGRTMVITPRPICYDEDGKRVPSMRLVEESGTTTFDFDSGETRVIRFRFDLDSDCPAEVIHTGIDCSGDGLRQQSLPIVIHRSPTMLADTIQTWFFGVAAVAGLLLLRAVKRRSRSKPLRTNQTGRVTDRSRRGDFSVVASRQDCRLEAETDVLVTLPDATSSKRLKAGQTMKIQPDKVTEQSPLTITEADHSDAPTLRIELIDWEPEEESVEAHFVVVEGGYHDMVASRSARSIRRWGAVVATCWYAAAHIHEPVVAGCCQWLIDAVLHV